MRKTLIISLSVLCTALAAGAQTFNIERVYKHFTTANGGTEARQGVFANDKFYIHNWMNQTVEVWNQDGEMIETFESKGTGPAITADEAGNIVIENTDNPWPQASGQTRDFRIFKGGKNDPVDISITFDGLRPTENGVRSDYFGPIEGNIASPEGGTLALMVQQRPVINVAKIAEFKPVDNFSIWVDTAYNGGNVVCNVGYTDRQFLGNWKTYILNGASYSQVTCFKFGDEYLMSKMQVGLKGYTFDPASKGSHEIETEAYRGILVNDHTTVYDVTASVKGDVNSGLNMSGDRLFYLGGRLYVIKHYQFKGEAASRNNFAIVDDETGKVVGLWHGYSNDDIPQAGTACASWLKVVPTGDTTAEIYQYFPADGAGKAFIAKYLFTLK